MREDRKTAESAIFQLLDEKERMSTKEIINYYEKKDQRENPSRNTLKVRIWRYLTNLEKQNLVYKDKEGYWFIPNTVEVIKKRETLIIEGCPKEEILPTGLFTFYGMPELTQEELSKIEKIKENIAKELDKLKKAVFAARLCRQLKVKNIEEIEKSHEELRKEIEKIKVLEFSEESTKPVTIVISNFGDESHIGRNLLELGLTPEEEREKYLEEMSVEERARLDAWLRSMDALPDKEGGEKMRETLKTAIKFWIKIYRSLGEDKSEERRAHCLFYEMKAKDWEKLYVGLFGEPPDV